MATGKRYYWMKLKETFMTSDTIDYFMSQPNGANYVVLYQMLCLKTINTNGRLSRQIGEIIIPYDVEKIQRDCKWFSVDTVRVALGLYRAAGLIYEDVDGTLVLADHNNLVGSETDAAARMRNMRAERENALPERETTAEQSANIVTQEIENRDQSLDVRDLDITNEDREIEREDRAVTQAETAPPPSRLPPCPFKKIMDLYHQICVSYPRIEDIEGERKKAVSARWRKYNSLDIFKELFQIAQASSFLKGQNDRNWVADFDWMMKPSNFSKIREHKYDNRTSIASKEVPLTGALGVLAKMREECEDDKE